MDICIWHFRDRRVAAGRIQRFGVRSKAEDTREAGQGTRNCFRSLQRDNRRMSQASLVESAAKSVKPNRTDTPKDLQFAISKFEISNLKSQILRFQICKSEISLMPTDTAEVRSSGGFKLRCQPIVFCLLALGLLSGSPEFGDSSLFLAPLAKIGDVGQSLAQDDIAS